MKYEPDESKQSKVSWEALATSFLKFCGADTYGDSSIKSVAGALSSLSQTALARDSNSKKSNSRTPSVRQLDGSSLKSQSSVGNESDDTQPIDDTVPMITSSPPTPPLETTDAFNLSSPEYRTLLSQLKVLIAPCLGHMFPNSSLKASRFASEPFALSLAWHLRALSDTEASQRAKKVPAFPAELTKELVTAIQSQLVKRTNSTVVTPHASPSRSKLGDLTEEHRTKTLSSIKHGTMGGIDTEELLGSPSKRFKLANGSSSVSHLLTPETTHKRILQLESEQDTMRREIAVLRAEIEQLKKPRNVLTS